MDMNGKRFAWQGVALLPFIDEERLLRATNALLDKLSPAERRRCVCHVGCACSCLCACQMILKAIDWTQCKWSSYQCRCVWRTSRLSDWLALSPAQALDLPALHKPCTSPAQALHKPCISPAQALHKSCTSPA